MQKMWHYKEHEKDTCLQYERAETRRQRVSLFKLGWDCACRVTHMFLPLRPCPQMLAKVSRVLILSLHINASEEAESQVIESMNNKDLPGFV